MKYSLFALLVLTISLTHAKLTDIPTLQTEMRTNGEATCTECRIRTYVPEKVEEYHVKTGTTDNAFAGTNANVWIKIKGEKGVTRKLLLDNPGKDDFQQGAVDDFKVYAEDVGKPMGFEVMRDDTVSNGVSAVWGIDSIGVKPYGAPKYLTFYYNFFLPAYTWIEFPRFTCLGTNEACYKEAAACPAGTKENSGKECFLKTLKCCTTETAASETKETE